MISIHEHSFSEVVDDVMTEQTVYEQLLSGDKHNQQINYVALPLAHLINTRGIPYTQHILNTLQKKRPERKIFVCQHIHVKYLNFFDNDVYTPHSTSKDNYKVILHYNPCIGINNYIEQNVRKYKFSFVGSYKTNPLRRELPKADLPDAIIKDTGDWHFYKKDRTEQTSQYVDILCNTKYALCPPGTGPSTIRLYEAMAAGCIPVVFNDVKVPDVIEPYIVRVKNVTDVKFIEMNDNSKIIHSLYWSNLSNDQLYKFILNG